LALPAKSLASFPQALTVYVESLLTNPIINQENTVVGTETTIMAHEVVVTIEAVVVIKTGVHGVVVITTAVVAHQCPVVPGLWAERPPFPDPPKHTTAPLNTHKILLLHNLMDILLLIPSLNLLDSRIVLYFVTGVKSVWFCFERGLFAWKRPGKRIFPITHRFLVPLFYY